MIEAQVRDPMVDRSVSTDPPYHPNWEILLQTNHTTLKKDEEPNLSLGYDASMRWMRMKLEIWYDGNDCRSRIGDRCRNREKWIWLH